MLRAMPGSRRMSPSRSRPRTIWWTEGGDAEMSLHVGFGGRLPEHARVDAECGLERHCARLGSHGDASTAVSEGDLRHFRRRP